MQCRPNFSHSISRATRRPTHPLLTRAIFARLRAHGPMGRWAAALPLDARLFSKHDPEQCPPLLSSSVPRPSAARRLARVFLFRAPLLALSRVRLRRLAPPSRLVSAPPPPALTSARAKPGAGTGGGTRQPSTTAPLCRSTRTRHVLTCAPAAHSAPIRRATRRDRAVPRAPSPWARRSRQARPTLTRPTRPPPLLAADGVSILRRPPPLLAAQRLSPRRPRRVSLDVAPSASRHPSPAIRGPPLSAPLRPPLSRPLASAPRPARTPA